MCHLSTLFKHLCIYTLFYAFGATGDVFVMCFIRVFYQSLINVFFTICLNLNEKMRKSIQGQVIKVKKGQIFKIYFLENKDMFLKQNLLSNPMVPLVFL